MNNFFPTANAHTYVTYTFFKPSAKPTCADNVCSWLFRSLKTYWFRLRLCDEKNSRLDRRVVNVWGAFCTRNLVSTLKIPSELAFNLKNCSRPETIREKSRNIKMFRRQRSFLLNWVFDLLILCDLFYFFPTVSGIIWYRSLRPKKVNGRGPA